MKATLGMDYSHTKPELLLTKPMVIPFTEIIFLLLLSLSTLKIHLVMIMKMMMMALVMSMKSLPER